MTILYPNHTSDPQAYLASEALWRRLFDRIKCEDYRGPIWTEWLGNTSADGTPCYDGSMAIYSQHCEAKSKGIKVWQVDPVEDRAADEFFYAQMEPWGEFGETDVLDISCVLTDANLAKADACCRRYMVDDLSAEEMAQSLEVRFPDSDGQMGAERPLALVALDYGLRKHFCFLRDTRGHGAATYDSRPGDDLLLSARMCFSDPGEIGGIGIFGRAKRHDDTVLLSYQVRDTEGALLSEGPAGALSAGCDAPEDIGLAADWLAAIRGFAEHSPDLTP